MQRYLAAIEVSMTVVDIAIELFWFGTESLAQARMLLWGLFSTRGSVSESWANVAQLVLRQLTWSWNGGQTCSGSPVCSLPWCSPEAAICTPAEGLYLFSTPKWEWEKLRLPWKQLSQFRLCLLFPIIKFRTIFLQKEITTLSFCACCSACLSFDKHSMSVHIREVLCYILGAVETTIAAPSWCPHSLKCMWE